MRKTLKAKLNKSIKTWTQHYVTHLFIFHVGRSSAGLKPENCCFVSRSYRSFRTKTNGSDLKRKLWRFFTQNSNEKDDKRSSNPELCMKLEM